MKNQKDRIAKAKIMFAQYPNQKSFHFTSDDQAFFEKSDAHNHAKSLDDKEVEEVFKNASLLKEDVAPLNADTLKKVANAVGATDESGNLIEGDLPAKVQKPKGDTPPVTKDVKGKAKPQTAAKAKSTAKAADNLASKEDAPVADQEVKPVEKVKEPIVDAAGGTDAK